MKKETKDKLKKKTVKILSFILNPRFLLCFGLAWMITNGWSYIMLFLGTLFGIKWMMAVSGAYIAFLYLPSPEKIVTLAIAMFLLKRLFPDDEKTLGVLREMKDKLKGKTKNVINKRKQKKADKQASDTGKIPTDESKVNHTKSDEASDL